MTKPRATQASSCRVIGRRVIGIAIPLTAFMVFFLGAVQFTTPELSFIPKNAKVVRTYVGDRANIARWASPIQEFTNANWSVHHPGNVKRMVREIEGKGYREHLNQAGSASQRLFLHRNGDQIYLQLRETSVRFNYIHRETRPLYCFSKSLVKVIDRTIIHRPQYR